MLDKFKWGVDDLWEAYLHYRQTSKFSPDYEREDKCKRTTEQLKGIFENKKSNFESILLNISDNGLHFDSCQVISILMRFLLNEIGILADIYFDGDLVGPYKRPQDKHWDVKAEVPGGAKVFGPWQSLGFRLAQRLWKS